MTSSNLVFSNHHQLTAYIQEKPLMEKSLQVAVSGKSLTGWSNQDHADSHQLMQRVAQLWNRSGFTNQYLIYGKIDSGTFAWEMVPYKKCKTFLGRAIQQLQVLWRTVFGGIHVPEESRKHLAKSYSTELNKLNETPNLLNEPNISDDAFCKNETIERQWVITGKKVNVLFNYAPIGFGGEKLHFLVVPKNHREGFLDVTQEEYCESLDLSTKLVDKIKETRKDIKRVYLLNKSDVDAGQTVKHWHLHVIFSSTPSQDLLGKLTVIKNILFGSSPMEKNQLTNRVNQLRKELAPLSKKSSRLLSSFIFTLFVS